MKMEDVEYKSGFREFIEEGISAENNKRYRPAVSNYYKALTIMCAYIVNKKTGKIPDSHKEIFLFLKVSFPAIHDILNGLFETYTNTYNKSTTKENCNKIKDAIKKVAKLGNVEKDFEEYIKKI